MFAEYFPGCEGLPPTSPDSCTILRGMRGKEHAAHSTSEDRAQGAAETTGGPGGMGTCES